jgi:hypothetical protein
VRQAWGAVVPQGRWVAAFAQLDPQGGLLTELTGAYDWADALARDPGGLSDQDALVQHWRRTMTDAALRFVDETLAAKRTTASPQAVGGER